MTTLSIELPTIQEPVETVSIIPENAKLLHTFIPTVEQVENNLRVFLELKERFALQLQRSASMLLMKQL